MNIAATHFVFQETGYRQRCAAGAGLHGETFFEVASSIVLHSALSAEEQDEDDPYADFKVPDDLMW